MKREYPTDARGYTNQVGASTHTGLSESWLSKARHHGYGPAYVKIGAAVRYSYAALDEFMISRARTGTRELA